MKVVILKKKKILSMIDVIGYLHQETIYCYIIILNVKWINFFIWRNNVLLYFWWIYKLHDLWRLVELLYIRSCNCFFKIFRNEILSDIGETIFTRNRLSRNMGCLNRNLYVMLKFTEWPKTLGRTSKKTSAFPEGNKQFCRWFCANLHEAKTDLVQFTKRWN